MLFQESTQKGKGDKSEGLSELKPAWTDASNSQIKVNISNKSRLRMLKQTDKEDTISGKYLYQPSINTLFRRLAGQETQGTTRKHYWRLGTVQLGPAGSRVDSGRHKP